MRRLALTLSAAAIALAAGLAAAYAHQWGPGSQQRPGMMMMDPDQMGPWTMGPGMMGGGMMGHGMSHMMMIMMDADGDGAVSLEEYQSLHARMFEAMDLDSDGNLTPNEMQEFMRSDAEAPDE